MTITGELADGQNATGVPAVDGGERCSLVRIARGDTAAFQELFAAHHGAVFAVVVSVLQDRAQAQEVTQEVFLQAWQQAARFDPILGSTAAWMKRLARRRAIDRVRLCHSASTRDSHYAVNNVTVDADVVISQVLHREEHAAVRGALLRLRPVQRESIVLAYYAGMSTADISEQLGVNRSTIKTRIRDGLRKLAADLGDPAEALAS